MSASAAAPSEAPKKRQPSCVGKSIVAFIDGGFFGAAIGSIVSSAQAIASVAGGNESFLSACRNVARSGFQSGLSLGGALAGYSGGVCTLESARGRRDVLNPFLVGGVIGAVGSVQRVEVHDGQHKRRIFMGNPRAMLGRSLSSAMLCSVFWYMQQPSKQRQDDQGQEQSPQPLGGAPAPGAAPGTLSGAAVPAAAGVTSVTSDSLTPVGGEAAAGLLEAEAADFLTEAPTDAATPGLRAETPSFASSLPDEPASSRREPSLAPVTEGPGGTTTPPWSPAPLSAETLNDPWAGK